MADTDVADIESAVKTDFVDELLDIYEEKSVIAKFAGKYDVEMGEGDTVRFNRLLRTAKLTTALSEGQVSFTDQEWKSNKIEVSIAEWGGTFNISKRAKIVTLIKQKDFRANLMDQVIATTEYQIHKVVSRGALRHRIDADATYQVSGTCDSGSAVTLVDDALIQNDDHWGASAAAHGYATITNANGQNYDITSLITNFVASTDTCTVAFPQAIDSTSKYRVVRGTGIVAGDVMTLTGLMLVAAMHEKMRTPKFDDGLYRCLLDAAQKRDLYAADAIQKYVYYDNAKAIGKYHMFRLLDTEYIVSPEIYREDADGTENQTTGAVYVSLFFGKDTFQICHWGDGEGDFGLEIIPIEKADSGNKLGMRKYLGWYAPYAGLVNRATGCIGLMTGATDLGVLI